MAHSSQNRLEWAIQSHPLRKIRKEGRAPGNFLSCVVIPAQNSERAKCVPAACAGDNGFHLQWNIFGMKEVERPAPVLVAALNHNFDGFTDAAVGFDSCISQIVESAQHVVVPERWEREAKPSFVDDFTGSKRAEHAALEQIIFGLLSGLRDRLSYDSSFAPGSFVFEQSFEHADGGMKR
jgi:hypothetical protein